MITKHCNLGHFNGLTCSHMRSQQWQNRCFLFDIYITNIFAFNVWKKCDDSHFFIYTIALVNNGLNLVKYSTSILTAVNSDNNERKMQIQKIYVIWRASYRMPAWSVKILSYCMYCQKWNPFKFVLRPFETFTLILECHQL